MQNSALLENPIADQLDEDQPRGQMSLCDEDTEASGGSRAARGIVTGVLLGAGAWGAIWLAVSALWHYRG